MQIKAKYTSVFDGYIICESECRYNPVTKVCYDIEPAGNSDDANNADVLTDEFITLPSGEKLREADGVFFDY